MSAIQIKRQQLTHQMHQHILDLMSAHYCNDEQAIDLVSGLADMSAGAAYREYSSVDLCDVAGTMQAEIEAFEEPEWCGSCAGSGEGAVDGTTCYRCRGRGELPSPKQVAERERMEA